jgi:hypothetical protein
VSFSYHPDAQAEFSVIRLQGGIDLRRCLGQAMQRHNRIFDGSEPLLWPQEFIGPGRRLAELFAVQFSINVIHSVEFVYDKLGPDVRVLALDATRAALPFGPRPGGDARVRGRMRSR